MQPLRVVRKQALENMKDRLRSGATLELYRGVGPVAIEERDLLESALRVPDDVPQLRVPPTKVEKAGSDVDNAILVHRFLGEMTEVQARDGRLWTYVTHVLFPAYCRERWPIPAEDDKAKGSVLSHWFVNDAKGLAALRRNAISRLWWAAHVTHAPWRSDAELGFLESEDDYVFTRALLSNQDIFQGTLERSFGSNRRVLVALLEVIRRDGGNRATTPFAKAFTKELNLVSRFRELAVLPPRDLVAAFEAIAVRVGVGNA